jgi:transposase InsO family protein
MGAILNLLGTFVGNLFKSRRRLEIENLFLRHQLNIALRRAPRRLRLRGCDRALRGAAWHDPAMASSGFRAYWRWKSRGRPGRPRVSRELRAMIRRMCRENPLWGAPRIHGEMLKLGFEIAESTVSRYMIRRRGPPSQTWQTFLRNHADAIAAIDLCLVPTLTFQCLFAFLVGGHGRRQLLWFAVTRQATAEWLAQQIVEAFPWDTAPTYLVRDNDGAYGEAFTRRIRAMGIRGRPISPRSPWQNPYVERLIGTLRRDCLDHVLIFGEQHLRRVLTLYSLYYNETRTHLGLSKDAPLRRAVQRTGIIVTIPILSGLHHRYARI